MKEYLKLMRIHHYIKNFLIFVPLFFAKKLFEIEMLSKAGVAFVAFSLLSSVVYIINDIQDIEKDREHPTKCKRPLASGKISKRNAYICVAVLSIIICLLMHWQNVQLIQAWILIIYFVTNIFYSCMGGKNIPIIDIMILASGFLLRILWGALVTDITVSNWLYLTITAMAFWMGLGKRRNELKNMNSGNTRKVLKYYTYSFLDKNMYMCMSLMIIFYSLWSVDAVTLVNVSSNKLVWSVPLVIVIAMKYSLDIEMDGENESDGDPVNVLLKDKALLVMGVVFVIIMYMLIY